jgi:opacity protein-like surface antigen
METIFKFFAVVLLFLSATGVQAQEDDWYAAVGAGVTFPSDSDLDNFATGVQSTTTFDNGYVLTGAAGKYFNNFRLEGEIFYSRYNIDNNIVNGVVAAPGLGHLDVMAYMANAYFDIMTNTKFTPYIGAGIGYVDVDVDDGTGRSDQGYAFQFKAGTAYQFTPSVDFIVGYRFFDTEDGNIGTAPNDADTEGAQAHHIEAAIRFRF